MTERDLPRWRRDPDAKRAALLAAARTLFARHDYTEVNVRAIAELAGVNQSLIFRYFGSKEKLFVAATSYEEEVAAIFADGPSVGLDRLLSVLLPDEGESSSAVVALSSVVGGDDGVHRWRRRGAQEVVGHLRELFDGPDAQVRAEALLAWLIGLRATRDGFGLATVARARVRAELDTYIAAANTTGHRPRGE